MKLIRKLGTKTNKSGNLISYGEFLCSNIECNKIVEKPLSQGKRDKFCGCNKIKHGETGSKLYHVWTSIKDRCLNIKSKKYKDWGGRGIAICPEWTNDYTKFRDWALDNGYQEGLEIDRIDNNDNYEPSNCRFATREINGQNRRTVKLTQEIANEIRALYKTGDYTQKELAEKYNVNFRTISYIINNKLWKKGE